MLWISRWVIDYLEIGKGIGEIAVYVILKILKHQTL